MRHARYHRFVGVGCAPWPDCAHRRYCTSNGVLGGGVDFPFTRLIGIGSEGESMSRSVICFMYDSGIDECPGSYCPGALHYRHASRQCRMRTSSFRCYRRDNHFITDRTAIYTIGDYLFLY